jgi:hypothetical protein
LSRFDFTLIHKPGKTNKVDGLSRRIDHKEGVENDNLDRILLPDRLFSRKISSTKDLFKADILGQGLTDDNRIPQTKEIQRIVAKTIKHGTIEIQGDLELKENIRNSQVLDFSVAQALEVIKENGPRTMSKGLQEWNLEDGLILYRLHPTEIPTKPYEIITSDLIVALPESDGFTAIAMITDRHSK